MILSQNEEIRLVLLSEYYESLFGENPVNEYKIKQLESINDNIISANLIWLIDHHLLEGTIEATGAGHIPFVSRISGHGMDVIETMVRELSDKVDPKISNDIKEKQSMMDKSILFIDLCIKVTQLSGIVAQYASKVFGH